ncbi:hypothetical protein KP509_15G060800 [Ceratopteris richardii]|uniref:Uncharacterized protein n=1 Tax=Ceratopteris richardii TaxID=49495 RepID=A0A8T2T5R3_CERRI|nr:hypothetical protein KP509_15G060800 [Ceratopteris richardii]
MPIPASMASANVTTQREREREREGRLEPPITIDREKTYPLLLCMITKIWGHHTVEDFAVTGKEPKDEVEIYIGRDAILRDFIDFVKEVAPTTRWKEMNLSVTFVYLDCYGRNFIGNVGMLFTSGGRHGSDENQALNGLNFQAENFLDLTI